MTFATLPSNTVSTGSLDFRDDWAEWQPVDDLDVQLCLSVIESSFEERDFTESEAEAYRQAMKLPVSTIPAQQLPFRE